VTVMVAEADFVASVTEVAAIVRVAGVGAVAGAAYFPVASIRSAARSVQPCSGQAPSDGLVGAAGTHRSQCELLHAAGLNRRAGR